MSKITAVELNEYNNLSISWPQLLYCTDCQYHILCITDLRLTIGQSIGGTAPPSIMESTGLLNAAVTGLERIILSICPARIIALYRATKFVYRLGFDVYSGINESETVLDTDVGKMPAKVFRPRGSVKTKPTIVVIHGLASSGYNDSRLLQLSRGIAGTGAVVVTPHIAGLTSCEISVQRVQEVTAAIESIAKDESLNESGNRVSVTSACITAGFVLIASTRTQFINAVLSIGTHASARHVLANCRDTRGLAGSMYAIESALLTTWARGDDELRALFHRSLEDDHLLIKDTPNAMLPKAIKQYPRAGKIYSELMEDWNKIDRALVEVYEGDKDMWEQVSPIRFTKQMQCKSITLVHADSDGIVPPIESRLLYSAVKKQRPDITAEVKITSLLDHGDKQAFGISAIPEALVLVQLFSTFFYCAFQAF